MFWLHRPPFLRWAAMAVLVAFAIFIDLRDQETESHPFAAEDLERGSAVTGRTIEWREVPKGLLRAPDLDGKVAARPIGRGEPFTLTSLTNSQLPPAGWWSVELPLPEASSAGQSARVVVEDPPLATDALIVSVAGGGAFASSTSGLVAVPAEFADALARAASRGTVVVLLSP